MCDKIGVGKLHFPSVKSRVIKGRSARLFPTREGCNQIAINLDGFRLSRL